MIQDFNNSTIKRVYDQYNPQDFSYGQLGSDNLNPKREMVLDRIDEIEGKIQEITNAIVLKKLNPQKDTSFSIKSSVLPEASSKNNLQKQVNLARVGSTDGKILSGLPDILENQLEELIGSLPTEVQELAKPPILNCKEVLKNYTIENKDYTVFDESSVLPTYVHNDEDEEDDDLPYFDDEEEEEENEELKSCDEIVLEFLKILIVILNILKVIRIIIDYMISTISVIIQIVCLAIGAWLNPPNIAQIAQLVFEIVLSLCMFIMSNLLQLLWNLLNLDCLADQTASLVEQIKQSFSAFRNIMGFIDPDAVSIIGKQFDASLDPLKNLDDTIKEKGDEWSKMISDIKEVFTDEGIEKLEDKIETEAKAAAKEVLMGLGTDGKAGKLFNQVSGAFASAKGDTLAVWGEAKKIYNLFKKEAAEAAKDENNETNTSIDALQNSSIENLAID